MSSVWFPLMENVDAIPFNTFFLMYIFVLGENSLNNYCCLIKFN